MIYLIGNQPTLCCEICHYPLGREPVALYADPTSAKHFPAVHVLCGEACAILCEEKMTTKPVRRLDWTAVVKALTQA